MVAYGIELLVPSSTTVLNPSGDTTGVTDTAKLNSLLNATSAYVKLGVGTYYFNSALNPGGTASPGAGSIVIEGSGWGTVLRFDGTVVSPAIVMADTQLRCVIIKNLRIAQTNASSAAGTCILADYFSSQSIIDNVRIDGLTKHWNIGVDHGLVSTNTHYTLLQNSRIQVDGSSAIGVRYGGGATGAISNVFRNNRVLISTTDGSQTGIVVATKNIELHHPDIESGAGIAIDLQNGADGCTIVNPYLDTNGTNLRLASGILTPVVIGGHIANGTADITDNGATSPKFIGVHYTSSKIYDSVQLGANPGAFKTGLSVSGSFLATPQPADMGYLGWAFDPDIAVGTGIALGASGTAGAGILEVIKIPLYDQSVSSTGVACYLTAAGSALTANECFVFLYNSAGTFIAATADQSVAWVGSAGLLTAAWASGPFTVSGAFCFVAFVYNGTTGPSLMRGSVLTAGFANGQLSAANSRYASILSGITTAAPGNFTPSSLSQKSATVWAAIY